MVRLAHRLRRWRNLNTTLCQCLLFSGIDEPLSMSLYSNNVRNSLSLSHSFHFFFFNKCWQSYTTVPQCWFGMFFVYVNTLRSKGWLTWWLLLSEHVTWWWYFELHNLIKNRIIASKSNIFLFSYDIFYTSMYLSSVNLLLFQLFVQVKYFNSFCNSASLFCLFKVELKHKK